MSGSDQILLEAMHRLGAREVLVAEDRVNFRWADKRELVFVQRFFRGDFYEGIRHAVDRI